MPRHVLLIGGNRFLGVELGFRLLAAGDRLTLLNRGTQPDPFGARVERVVADRGSDAFDRALAGRRFDAVVDCALFTGDEARRSARVFSGNVGHWVMVSTGQVYLVRRNYRPNAVEGDYDGPLLERPTDDADLSQWQYGIDKREAEDVVISSGIDATRVRLPMVHGAGDYYRRIESYLWRLLDDGPLLVPNADGPARHVYVVAAARALQRVLDEPAARGHAYNVCQDETVTVRELVVRIAWCLGVEPRIVVPSDEQLSTAGLTAVGVSPFSGRWMSCLDPSLGRKVLGLHHERLDGYVGATVHALLHRWPKTPPPALAQRPAERALAERC